MEAIIHIGQLIERELRHRGLTVTWLSRAINCDRRNVYDIFTRANIDTALLMKISKAMSTNFFILYAEVLSDYPSPQTTKSNI